MSYEDTRTSLTMIREWALAGGATRWSYLKDAYLRLVQVEADRALEALEPPTASLARDLYVFENTQDETTSPLIYGRRTLTPEMYEAVAEPAGVKMAIMPYAWEMGVDQTEGTVDLGKLEAWVSSNIDSGYTGLVCPDIEGQIKVALHNDSDTIKHEQALSVYNTVTHAIREHAPGAVVMYYAVPTTHYWIGGKTLEQAADHSLDALADLAVDWWCPNLYDNSLDDVDPRSRSDLSDAWKRSMMQCSRDLQSERGGQIIAMVYERIDSHHSAGNRRLIPNWEILRDQVILGFDEGADGLGWWGKAERVLAQGSWSSWSDCAGMSRSRATEYLLDELPRRLLEEVFLPACRTYE